MTSVDVCLKLCPGDIDRAIPVAVKQKQINLSHLKKKFIKYYLDQRQEHWKPWQLVEQLSQHYSSLLELYRQEYLNLNIK